MTTIVFGMEILKSLATLKSLEKYQGRLRGNTHGGNTHDVFLHKQRYTASK